MKNTKKHYFIIASILILLFIAVIYYLITVNNSNEKNTDKMGDDKVEEYKSITKDEAKQIFETEGDYIILDVRRADEYASGHIHGAINVANEDISSVPPEELPDKNQFIYVYCRSGRRSKEASAKLAQMGYTNIIEIGGILDWTGEIEK